MRTLKEAARVAYKKVGIKEPLKEFDVAEIYEPVSYAELAWYELLGLCKEGEAGRLIDDGVTEMDGELPVNPSGGVMSTILVFPEPVKKLPSLGVIKRG